MLKLTKKKYSVFNWLCWLISLHCGFFTATFAQNNFTLEFETFKKDPALKHSSFALVIADPKTDKIIFNHNGEISLTPASTLKLLTTSASLQLLGNDYHYKTYIALQGTIQDSILQGNLVIIGSGDPTLGSENFEENLPEKILTKIYTAIKTSGIKKINGNIMADVNSFDDALTPPNWLWTDMGNYFGAGPSGLNFTDNKISVFFKSGKNAGDSTWLIKTNPKIENFKIINQLTSGAQGSGDNAYFYGSEYQNVRVVRGSIPPNKEMFEVNCSMPDAALYMMQELKNYLQKKNISITGEPTTTRILSTMGVSIKPNYQVIDSILSPPLSKIVYYTNLKSINLYAEALLKTISLITAKQGNITDGVKVIEQFLKNINISTNGLRISDGSGLSPMNKITSLLQVQLLNYMYKQTTFKSIESSLPVAGQSGSIASMFKNTLAQGNLKAKSGYINNVRTYTGYFTGKSGELRSFSFLVNNYYISAGEMKRKMEQLMIKMVENY